MNVKDVVKELEEIGYTGREIEGFIEKKQDYTKALGKAQLGQTLNYLLISTLSAGMSIEIIIKTGCKLNEIDFNEIAQGTMIAGNGTISTNYLVESYKLFKKANDNLGIYESVKKIFGK